MSSHYDDLSAKGQSLFEIAKKAKEDMYGDSYNLETGDTYGDVDYGAGLEGFVSLFSDFYWYPDGSQWDSKIANLEQALYHVNSGNFDDPGGKIIPSNTELTELLTAAGFIGEWDGVAADEFISKHVLPFNLRMNNVYNAIAVLKGGYESLKVVWSKVPDNLEEIYSETKHALENCYECNADDWAMALKAASLVATVAVPFIGVAGLAVSAGATSITKEAVEQAEKVHGTISATFDAATAVGGSKLETDPDSEAHSADTPEEVLKQAEQAVSTLTGRIARVEQSIATGMDAALAALSSYGGDFVPPRPSLATVDTDRGLIGRPGDDSDGITWVPS
ncbi:MULTISPECIES: hypothetical protein [unclassified Nocardioides]|jgi:hypothetical protein|uniref:hypothetical protein n=1 Tax=unclassified Nocardioides TaxID=2615069 RepID=UPI000703082B|nr:MULTISPECIES: hypothetical protein [unclassified Nocardioides]KRC53997.1 hypothetical protein ASE19_07935 [Nocardioides sp. Root79]KRC71333.1 hypothetical protein ASE20_10350 [Nocardioides sp. Root240]